MFVLPFIDQYLCTILYILDQILIAAPTRLGVHCHLLQEPRFTIKFFETHRMMASICWPLGKGW